MASVALFVSLGGGAYAAMELPANSVGTRAIRNDAVTSRKLAGGSVTASKVALGSLTGKQIDVARLGTVPDAEHSSTADMATSASSAATATSATSASSATHAATADTATIAGTATNAQMLGGLAASAFQTRVTGSCGTSAAVTQINVDGTVACTNVASNVQVYAGRIKVSAGASNTFLTIPGVAHVAVFICSGSAASAEVFNDDVGHVDMWIEGPTNGFQYDGAGWADSTTGQSMSGGEVLDLGVGTGTGAQVIKLTLADSADGNGSCTFQASAEVVTAAG